MKREIENKVRIIRFQKKHFKADHQQHFDQKKKRQQKNVEEKMLHFLSIFAMHLDAFQFFVQLSLSS